jgi:hypothetical protein
MTFCFDDWSLPGRDFVSVYGWHAMHPHQKRSLYGEAG